MAGKTSRAPLHLTEEESRLLHELSHSRTASVREVERARILLAYARSEPLRRIARSVGVAPATVYKCVDKALGMGVAAGLRDLFHRPREAVIGDDAKAWVVHIACTKPKDAGPPLSRSALSGHDILPRRIAYAKPANFVPIQSPALLAS